MPHTEDHAARHKTGQPDVIKLDELGAPTNNTDLNASITAHGLCPLLPNDATKSVNGGGAWTVGANPFLDYCEVQDQRVLGTEYGDISSGAWRTRVLNTELYDPNNFCALAANRFTLTKGLYFIEAMAFSTQTSGNRVRIWSATRGSLLLGMNVKSEYCHNAFGSTYAGAVAHVSGQITVTAATEAFELQHRVQRTGAGGIATGWDVEVYAIVKIFRLRADA
jgi:hypothetical protein